MFYFPYPQNGYPAQTYPHPHLTHNPLIQASTPLPQGVDPKQHQIERPNQSGTSGTVHIATYDKIIVRS